MRKLKNRNFAPAFVAFGLLLVVIVIGIIGYQALGFTLVEAFYQTVITISTVGFKEVHILDDAGMIFTALLIIFSLGIFAYAVSTLTLYVVEGIFRNTIKDSKVKRKIDRLSGHVVICGYGRNGKQAASELLEHKVPILIIEKKPEIVQQLRDQGEMLYIEGDSIDEEVLSHCHLETAKALITTLPEDADNLFVVLSAKELNPKLKIISRASLDHSDVKLKRAGATNVIMPDKIGGQRMAKLVAQADVVEFIDYMLLQSADNVVLEEISCDNIDSCFAGKSISELYENNDNRANIIGLKKEDGNYLINPLPDTLLSPSDKLFLLGTRLQIVRMKEMLAGEQDDKQ